MLEFTTCTLFLKRRAVLSRLTIVKLELVYFFLNSYSLLLNVCLRCDTPGSCSPFIVVDRLKTPNCHHTLGASTGLPVT